MAILTFEKDERLVTKVNHKIDATKEIILGHNLLPFLLQFAFASFNEGDSIEKHKHSTANEIFYIIKGKVLILGKDFEKSLTTGGCFVIEANEEHGLKFLEETELIYFLLEHK